MTEKEGSLIYSSPEEILGHSYNEKKDSWSIGIVFYALLKGTFIFEGKNEESLLMSIMTKTKSFDNLLSDLDMHC